MDKSIKFIEGVIITPLKKISNAKGDVYPVIKCTDNGFKGFGEAYFSSINYNEIKAWKQHQRMTLNLTVPLGIVRFVLCDLREGSLTFGLINEIIISPEDYKRISIPPKVWFGFKGSVNRCLYVIVPNDKRIEMNYDDLHA